MDSNYPKFEVGCLWSPGSGLSVSLDVQPEQVTGAANGRSLAFIRLTANEADELAGPLTSAAQLSGENKRGLLGSPTGINLISPID